eukprot:TRINITY_DN39211_c0_g1_i1.p1 TRINITY_DN39211_c0_g1~~TRINITY_DN39211_c0_g1_i1.p1  ORF type:complete len:1388 (-),score=190.97 TRINITY_DN39211_c0_g1_i1:250-4413(-)
MAFGEAVVGSGLRGRHQERHTNSGAALNSGVSCESIQESFAPHGLSTTVAHERLVEEVELVINRFVEQVTAISWKSRLGSLSILHSFEVVVALLCSALLAAAAAIMLDTTIFAEVLLVVLAHFFAWYISFRLPRVEQFRAIAKVQDCIQKFISNEDAFTCTTRNGSTVGADDVGCYAHDVVPPSSFCVSVLRDRVWRQIPYNMLVAGDVFRLRDGEIFPCRAESLIVNENGAQPSGEVRVAGQVFTSVTLGYGDVTVTSGTSSGGSKGAEEGVVLVGSFRALKTACVPLVTRFLEKAQRPKEGRTDTVFFELAELLRLRIKRVALAAFIVTAAAVALWLFRPEVAQQGFHWHLRRALVPVRLVICLLPLMHTILLQITDVWGNARIQSLFEWHAGLTVDQRGHGHDKISEEVSPGSGEIDASRVPLQRQLRELLDILRQGLDGPSNLMHTLNSTTVVCFCDKEGLLTDTCTTISEVCLCGSSKREQRNTESSAEEVSAPALVAPQDGTEGQFADTEAVNRSEVQTPPRREQTDEEKSEPTTLLRRLQTVVLDVQRDPAAFCGLRFEDADWRRLMPMLKPLGLAMAVSRQPRDVPEDGASLCNLSVIDVLHAIHRGGSSAALGECLCNVSKLIGFKDEAIKGFGDPKFCMELCRPHRVADTTMEKAVSLCYSEPSSIHERINPEDVVSPALGPAASPCVLGMRLGEDEQSPALQQDDFEHAGFGVGNQQPSKGTTNYSRSLMTWFVNDSRDGSSQMFCKGKPKCLLPRCTHYFDGSRVMPLCEDDKQDLLRLVLQWKASGLSALAYAYRPLATRAEIEVPERLSRFNFFCTTESQRGSKVIQDGVASTAPRGIKERDASLPADLADLQEEQVLLGMAGMKLSASVQMSSYAEALQGAGIRFQVYCCEGDKRTRTLGSQLGLETGWNCLISLEKIPNEAKNMMGQVVLPSGIPDIRRHTKEVDNVPLLVSLFSKATPWRAQQMIDILQENSECVTCVGSALQPNFETFRQANISVSVLVSAVPRCRRCFGQREPKDGVPEGCERDLLLPGTVNRAEFQLSADFTSLPCALQARHSYSNGEQRTLGVLFNAIKEARRCVDCIFMVLIHYVCGSVELGVIIAAQALLCLPAPLEGIHVVALLLLLLPGISLALLFNAASPQLMRELPLKKADEMTLAQPGRLMALYALRSIPTALVVVAAFVFDLHHAVTLHLERMRMRQAPEEVVKECANFAWQWWLTGRWPNCVRALSRPDVGAASNSELSCALVRSQQWGGFLFLIYQVTLAFTFLDRYDSLHARGPASNFVLCGVAVLALLIHSVASFLVLFMNCSSHWEMIHVPSWEVWVILFIVWPAMAVALSECTKHKDRKSHNYLQRTLRVLFNTRLGMWSPK